MAQKASDRTVKDFGIIILFSRQKIGHSKNRERGAVA